MSAAPAIVFRNLTKMYGKSRGIEGISFEVQPGQVFGFLGPNGAGKSTAMRTLIGLIKATSGEAEILGKNSLVGDVSLMREVGYLPGALSLYKNLTAKELLNFMAKMRGKNCDREITTLAERLNLDLHKHIHDLSKGNRQKVGVIQALMHKPKVLILDEPTSGLDPLIQREFNLILDEIKAEGASVLLSSHVLSEVEHLADRVAVISEGKILLNEDIAQLKTNATQNFVFTFQSPVNVSDYASLPGVINAQLNGNVLTCGVGRNQTALLQQAAKDGVVSLTSKEPTLDEIFLTLIDKELKI